MTATVNQNEKDRQTGLGQARVVKGRQQSFEDNFECSEQKKVIPWPQLWLRAKKL